MIKTDVNNQRVIVSYRTLRLTIGGLAMLLPCLLFAWTWIHEDCNEVLPSISIYHHTVAGHVFTTMTVLIAVIFFIYDGYDNDRIILNIASVLALGVGFIPNLQKSPVASCMLGGDNEIILDDRIGCYINSNSSKILADIHLGCAIGLFLLLAYICFFIFTRSNKLPADQGSAKRNRNKIYRFCGSIIILIILLLSFYFIGRNSWAQYLTDYNPIFWGECVMIWAFGISWLTKGEFFFSDESIA